MTSSLRVGALVLGLLLLASGAGAQSGPGATDEVEDAENPRNSPDAAGPAAGGDEAETVEARRLFSEGLEFVEALDWSRAAERFRAVRRVRPTPSVEYNLAASLFELGALNESEEIATGVLDDPATDEQIRDAVQSLLERIRITGGQLTVHLTGARGDESVFLDARQVAASRVGAPMTTSVGEHVVEARRGHEAVARASAEVNAGQPAEVTLDVYAEPVAAVGAPVVPSDDGAPPSLLADWRFWAVVGGSVVVIAAIIIIAAAAAGGGGYEAPIAGTFQPGVLTWN